MQLYDIYTHPKLGSAAVKRGFSWMAFFAPSVWAATKGLGMITLILVAATTLAFNLAAASIQWFAFLGSPTLPLILLLTSLGFVAGMHASKWHKSILAKKGYRRQSCVVALNARHAQRAFASDNYLSQVAIAA